MLPFDFDVIARSAAFYRARAARSGYGTSATSRDRQRRAALDPKAEAHWAALNPL
jgi:hypothetical protein